MMVRLSLKVKVKVIAGHERALMLIDPFPSITNKQCSIDQIK